MPHNTYQDPDTGYVAVSNSIDATLEETQKKLADLTNTAERMNSIISDSKCARIRQRVRTHSISIIAVFVVTTCLLAANLYLIHSVVQMNENFDNISLQIESRQQRILNQVDHISGLVPYPLGNPVCPPLP
jgi:hypothetical protein